MSSENFFIDKKYGFEIYSKATKKINNNTLGMLHNSDFYIMLTNNTSGNVAVNVYLDGAFVGNYEILEHSIYKVTEPLNPNQFFVFKPSFYDKKNNMKFSELKLEWIPITTQYTYVSNPHLKKQIRKINPNSYYDVFPPKYFGQTTLEYDKRINYGCIYDPRPEFTFDDDLNLGISSDKYKLEKKYINGNKYTQIINFVELNPKYPLVNVRDYFVYNEKYLDFPEKQLLDRIM